MSEPAPTSEMAAELRDRAIVAGWHLEPSDELLLNAAADRLVEQANQLAEAREAVDEYDATLTKAAVTPSGLSTDGELARAGSTLRRRLGVLYE